MNPLFQDSTVSSGTNIRTQFELKKAFIDEGEKIFISLLEQSINKFIELKCLDAKTGTYSCSVWLKHKQDIKYQFFVKSAGKIKSVSELKTGFAMYTILETWRAEDDLVLLEEFSAYVAASPESAFTEEAEGQCASSEDMIENLIEKWGL